MKKVILFFPKLEEYKDYHYFPVSLLSVAAPIVAMGVECKIIDERINENYEEELLSQLPDALCFCTTAFTGHQLHRAYEVSRFVRQNFPSLPIIWGGQHITNLPKQTVISKFVDIGVIGYGEHIFKELISRLMANKTISDLAGIVYKDSDNKIQFNPPSNEFETANLSPLPYKLINVEKYINPATKRFVYISSYGCPGVCTFCSTENQRRWKVFPLEKYKADISHLLDNYKFEEVFFFDATVFTLPNRFLEMADYISQYGVKLIVDGRALEMYRLDEDYFRKLINFGLKNITVGLETGSQNVVDIMKKGKRHLYFFEKTAEILSRLDFPLISGLIFGTPGETPSDLKETILYVKKIKKINKNFRLSSTFFRPLPGTELYFQLMKQGYHFPDSLEGWSEEKEHTHYKYNQWMDIPWMSETEKNEYHKIYDNFMEEEKDLFV